MSQKDHPEENCDVFWKKPNIFAWVVKALAIFNKKKCRDDIS